MSVRARVRVWIYTRVQVRMYGRLAAARTDPSDGRARGAAARACLRMVAGACGLCCMSIASTSFLEMPSKQIRAKKEHVAKSRAHALIYVCIRMRGTPTPIPPPPSRPAREIPMRDDATLRLYSAGLGCASRAASSPVGCSAHAQRLHGVGAAQRARIRVPHPAPAARQRSIYPQKYSSIGLVPARLLRSTRSYSCIQWRWRACVHTIFGAIHAPGRVCHGLIGPL